MKKVIVLLLLGSFVQFLNIGYADEPSVVLDENVTKISGILEKIPALNQGFAYSIADNNFNYLATLDVVSWKALTLEAGYAGRAENTTDKAVIVASVKLLDLGDIVHFPILDKIVFRPGVWYGWGNLGNWNNAEGDWGVSASVISLKF